MIGIDTNILVRIVTRDDEPMAQRAYQIIQEECSETQPAFVATVVLLELVWTLKSHYKYGRKEITKAIKALVSAKELRFENMDAVHRALDFYAERNTDFADALIGAIHKYEGCTSTLTLDKKAAKLPDFEEG